LKQCLKKWAETDFKNDPSLNLIPSMFHKLKSEGHDFSDLGATPKKQPIVLSKDPNVVSSQQEEDDIAKAIELSLKEKGSPKSSSAMASVSQVCQLTFFYFVVFTTDFFLFQSSASSTLYPSMGGGSAPLPEPRKVI
jgi:signal transducing adaptor molecule